MLKTKGIRTDKPSKANVTTFKIYNVTHEVMLSREYDDRQEANEMCDWLEKQRGHIYVPVRFVNGKQAASV